MGLEAFRANKTPAGDAAAANAARDGGQAGDGQPNDPGRGETTEKRELNIGQGENANGENDSKEDHSASTLEMGGVTKVIREEGRDRSKKDVPEHVVQQGGGGAVRPSGDPI